MVILAAQTPFWRFIQALPGSLSSFVMTVSVGHPIGAESANITKHDNVALIVESGQPPPIPGCLQTTSLGLAFLWLPSCMGGSATGLSAITSVSEEPVIA
jgi:hypothetical protein